ncbi:hypothetical protein N7495_000896 [Penicillium taxi]|uniref:uncharacterized protein n=1 Tax=Penicillium taxi TaxID=168475 RepID=UPI002544F7FA|nr:uncharacterized protein N7495_000896 [Penicillium taxi]KAJ5908214.1 hypothetical protein N7495_000896 [Penicillium taxi]
MKLFTCLSVLLATALATPLAKSTKEFRLKTVGATHAKHNDLYLHTYHTGAGLNDATLGSNGTSAPSFYLNETRALADLGTDFTWGLIATGDTNYAAWEPIEINAGGGSTGFSITNGTFVWDKASGFGGWLVCDWFHNTPQLFYLYRYYDATIPSSCSKALLKPIYK